MTPKGHVHAMQPGALQRVVSDDTTQIQRSVAGSKLTLLCTDLEGFTSTVQRLGDVRARALIRRHNRLLRKCLARSGGYEATHTGDGILASFQNVARAIECAKAMQLGLRVHNRRHEDRPLRVRIGLHVGAPLPEEGRLFGSCVNVTVRICGVAAAERIYVSDELRQLAAPLSCTLLDRGLFSLKGIGPKLRLHELVWQ
jgi:class 3 adenylate cyclase